MEDFREAQQDLENGDFVSNEGDRQWVKYFGASNKNQAVYELAAWLDSLGLKLTVTVKQKYTEDCTTKFQDNK
ncbi:MAG: hypothetical protein NW214_11600 [Pseudanabaenaceae cyanobacterium bins.39]|nr:hypothetical protein [Pseudanabaenaceae cyanobacterium bins.39]